MTDRNHQHDAIHWHLNEIASRIIADTGIPSDRYHMGKIIYQSLKDDPDMVAQIDGSTGKSETNSSVLNRSIQCALALRKLGLKHGDVMVLMSQNHLDVSVTFNAALFEGLIIAPVDTALGVVELAGTFEVDKPKIVFCHTRRLEDVQAALNKAKLTAEVISFDGADNDTFSDVLKLGNDEKEINNYRPADFDPSETIALLIPTSGTTGLPKAAAATHKNFAIMGPYFWNRISAVPFFKRSLVASTLQWLSAILNYSFSSSLKFTRIQSSQLSTQEHLYHLINTYRPCYAMISPTLMSTLLKPGVRDSCDFTCFKSIDIGGSAVYSDLISELKLLSPKTDVVNVYGMSELTCRAFVHGLSSPPHSCGKPLGSVQYRLVDPDSGKDINEPNKNGELWVKGPGLFKGYYNNPEATKEVFSEDNWFKSGDILYRDESWNFFFVERMKLLLKYMNNQISPVELESIVIQHPGVLDVAVTGIPDPGRGELPVACVVKKSGYSVTAQEIKDLVKENLTDSKQLRGGVVFFDQLPLTASSKLHRRKIKEMVLSMKRE